MLKKLFSALLALLAVTAFAATDLNKADQAALEAVKGIGPSLSQRLLDERKKGAFKDWPNVIERVKGISSGNAARFSAAGLTVNGSSYAGMPATATGTGTAKTPADRRDRTAASAGDGSTRKAAGAASMPRATPPAISAASAAKAGAKP